MFKIQKNTTEQNRNSLDCHSSVTARLVAAAASGDFKILVVYYHRAALYLGQIQIWTQEQFGVCDMHQALVRPSCIICSGGTLFCHDVDLAVRRFILYCEISAAPGIAYHLLIITGEPEQSNALL